MGLLRFLHLPTFIGIVLPIAQALLISIKFHDTVTVTVDSRLPLPSLCPPMPLLFPLFLRLPAILVNLDCAS